MIQFMRNRFADTVLVCIAAVSVIVPIVFLAQYLLFPYPLAYRETAPLLQAMAFHQGQNPYLLEGFPAQMYVYGPLFPLMISPWINLIRPALIIPRMLNIVFLVFSAVLLYALLRARKASVAGALTASVVLGNALCLVIKIAGPGPDLPGFFFVVLGFYVLQKSGSSMRGLWMHSLCGVVAFYIKQYLILPFVLYSVYVFLFQSKRRGLWSAGLIAIQMALPAAVLRVSCPMFFRYTVLHHLHMYSDDIGHMVMQLETFLSWYAFPVAVFSASVLLGLRTAILSGSVRFRMHVGSLEKPLVEGMDADFFMVGFLSTLLIMVMAMGRNAGTAHTYFQELPLPFLIVSVFTFIAGKVRPPNLQTLLYAACLSSLMPLGRGYQIHFQQTAEGFQQLNDRADRCEAIYGSAAMDWYLLNRDGETIYDSGNTEYAITVLYAGNPLLQKVMGGHDGQIEHQWIIWNDMLGEKARQHAFDCIIVGSETTEIGNVRLEEYYEPEREIPDILEWDVVNYSVVFDAVIWIPKQ
jgi:hypothetical protein